MEQKRFFWLWGVLVLVVVMLAMAFLGAPLQARLGLWGVFLTEIMLLIIAVAAALIMRIDLKEMLRIKPLRVRQIIGIVIMVLSGMILASGANYVVFWFYPQGMQVVDKFADLFSSLPGLLTWMIVAVLPGICEEVLHRGFILHTFSQSGIKGKWPVILWMGLIFGLFHLDPVRFLATGILGMILTYLALKTENFLAPVLYHLLHNTLSVLPGIFATVDTGSLDIVKETMLAVVGLFLILAALALFTLRLGARLVGPKLADLGTEDAEKLKASRKKMRIITACVSILLFVIGITCMVLYTLHTIKTFT